jgi:hypothetical protein
MPGCSVTLSRLTYFFTVPISIGQTPVFYFSNTITEIKNVIELGTKP